jgi:hypothetical protein
MPPDTTAYHNKLRLAATAYTHTDQDSFLSTRKNERACFSHTIEHLTKKIKHMDSREKIKIRVYIDNFVQKWQLTWLVVAPGQLGREGAPSLVGPSINMST